MTTKYSKLNRTLFIETSKFMIWFYIPKKDRPIFGYDFSKKNKTKSCNNDESCVSL